MIPHRWDPKLFWDESDWQALCKRCHGQKTGGENRWKEYRYLIKKSFFVDLLIGFHYTEFVSTYFIYNVN